MTSTLGGAAAPAADSLAELAEVLAAGYLRLLAKRRKELEQSVPADALCGELVDAKETVARKERA